MRTPLLPLLGVTALAYSATMPIPKTPVHPVTETIHGVEITDNYRWLENPDSPETKAWIDDQIQYTKSFLDPLPGRAALRRTVEQLTKVDLTDVPIVRGGRSFFSKRTGDQNQSVICLRRNGKEEVLLDPNPLSADHSTSAQISAVRMDGKVFAYGIRKGGQDEVETFFMDAGTRQLLPDRLPVQRTDSVQLTPDGKGVFYGVLKPGIGPHVFYHAMGTPVSEDRDVFGSTLGADWFCGPNLSDHGRFVLFEAYRGASGDKSDLYFQDLSTSGPIRPLVKNIEAVFIPVWAGDDLFILTNWKAPNKRVMKVDLAQPDPSHWTEIVPERTAVLTNMTTAGGKLVLNYLEDVNSHLRVVDSAGKPLREIQLPSLGSVEGVSGDWGSQELYFGFTSFAFPFTIYRADLATGEQDLWFRTRVPIDVTSLETKQVWFNSQDGTRVPMFVITRKGLALDGSRPALLYGYGGFNVAITPYFSALFAAWAAQGGVVAVSNLRGGGEFGEAWHQAGMLDRKQNVFDDFTAASQWLIANHYTNSAHLGIYGGSNGGLLVGAALTQHPELFRAVVCAVPLLDMIRYQNFSIAKTWTPEYGSSEDARQFRTLFAYSPYHRVKAGVKYPSVLFVTGTGDTRVDPLHARKMAALLQASVGDSDRPVLLRYDKIGGHSGSGGVNQTIDQNTDILAFLAWQLGLKGF